MFSFIRCKLTLSSAHTAQLTQKKKETQTQGKRKFKLRNKKKIK